MVKKVYLIAGHGTEELVEFSKRTKVPPGKIIVSFPVCGRANFMKACCRITHMLKQPEYAELFSNPIDNKRAIEELFNVPMRIYIPNDYFPQLSTNLFLDFEEKGLVLMKSGVYRVNKIPQIDRTIIPNVKTVSQKLGTTFCVPFIGLLNSIDDYTQTVHNELFRGNVFKPAVTEHNRFMDRSFTLNEITDAVGNGIYYYIGCRAVKTTYGTSIFSNIFQRSDNQQEKSNRIMPLLENASASKSRSVSRLKTIKEPPKKERRSLNRRHRVVKKPPVL
jgi:hypothetical protein